MQPRTEAELAEAVRGAAGPLRICGGGTRGIGRVVPGELLSLAGISGISLYEPGALTLVAAAGTPLEEIEAALAAEGQMLAFEPMDHRVLLGSFGVPTIGGVVAANVSGPRRVSAVGACRDALLGVRFVDGSGQVIKNGGRVMKNVTGYDLSKLMAGAYGTLGVLSEVALKVLPRPEAETVLTIAGLDAGQAVKAMAAALGSPYEVTGAAYDPARGVHMRVEGLRASVQYRARELAALLAGFGTVALEEDRGASAALWQQIRDVERLAPHQVVVRVSMKPSDLPVILQDVGAGDDYLADWGGGLLWIAASETDGPALLENLQQFCARSGGHATLVKAPEAMRRSLRSFQPEPAALAALTAGLRARFDPRGILNPGLME
ncbi:FAD-binding protein [Pararhodobacter oceanensis]|uniref:2-hydroxy-acid oxidase n=1 Tax=Pararhodobacter oceanensis TaxID=2172121 RepID=A0A2T8HUU9_9RHOB|nr:FAD-binding protein [Pararhodobacter oceanensis]PVH29184.1 2-hydroxy-acid oxidase [Pararhodobacter oceanensis]